MVALPAARTPTPTRTGGSDLPRSPLPLPRIIAGGVAEEVGEVLTQREYEKLLAEKDPEVAAEESRVQERLEQKRAQQQRDREKAKEVFRKLRERRETLAKKCRDKPDRDRGPGPEPVPPNNVNRDRPRLDDVMMHVARARESVNKAVAAANDKEHAPRMSLDAADRGGDNEDDDEVDEDLQITLDSWLRNVGRQDQQAQKNRRRVSSPRSADEGEVEEEADCKRRVYEGTASISQLHDQAAPGRSREEGKDAGRGDGEVEEDDEVAALQSMLAQELLLHDHDNNNNSIKDDPRK